MDNDRARFRKLKATGAAPQVIRREMIKAARARQEDLKRCEELCGKENKRLDELRRTTLIWAGASIAGFTGVTLLERAVVARTGKTIAGNIIEWIKRITQTAPKIQRNPDEAPSGFEWRGKSGSIPGSKEGSWYNPNTGEVLRPDLDHQGPIGPRWDYRDPSGRWCGSFKTEGRCRSERRPEETTSR